ncbi:peptidase S1 [Pseudoroseicyclus tamaricis]|uniref:Peptidase S1 n=1 Tax=Pseudoroseicyclus tamaricis TaxID=2705421 RepID=A0A6B2JHG5_9RHOB|nr:peptidase S1 [Pseudoroseicyclus tamaricis]NDV00731.1 peptidase S1 [Pseudoroseicyclus tamaricis]
MIKRFCAAMIAALALSGGTAMACPDWSAAPHFGDISLSAGFLPDPHVRNVTAGGTQLLTNCGFNLPGYVTSRPDFDLYWSGSSSMLTITVTSGADAVLLVNAPDQQFYYDDDTVGTNPSITFYNPQPGLYDIWIGSYDGSRRNPAQLIFTEMQ